MASVKGVGTRFLDWAAGKVGPLVDKYKGASPGSLALGVARGALGFAVSHPAAMMAGAGAIGGYATTGDAAGGLAGAGIGLFAGRKGWGRNNSSFARRMAKESVYSAQLAVASPEGRKWMREGVATARKAHPKITRGEAFKRFATWQGRMAGVDVGRQWSLQQAGHVKGWSRGLKMATVAGVAGIAAGGTKMAWGIGTDVFGSRKTGNSYGAERTSGYGASFSGMGNGIVGGY